MQAIENLPPTPDPGASSKTEASWNKAAQGQSLLEQFDAVMGRTLARSSRGASADTDPSDDPSRVRDKTQQSRKSSSTTLSHTACGENAAAPAPSSRHATAAGSRSGSGLKTQVEDVSGSDPSTAPASTTAKDAAAGSSSSADEPSEPSATDSSEPGIAGSTAKTGTAGDQSAGSDRLLAALTAAAGKAALDAQGSDAAGSAAGAGKPAPAPGSAGGPGITGISSAQQQLAMQKAEEMNVFSASAEQNLPAPPASVTGEELPASITHPLNSLPGQRKADPALATDSSVSLAPSPTQTASSAAASSQWPSEMSLRSLERTHDLISLHAFRLRDSGADSMQVVIKPGPDLQLSLSLQMRDGGIDMRATLNRGDFDMLNRHWPDLQHQLESRGVRLAPLICSDQSPGGGQNLFQQADRQSSGGDTVASGAFGEFTPISPLKPATTIKTMQTPRSWESWA
jgi:hypothetical protein